MIHLVPVYKQQLKREKPTKRLVPQWTEAAIQRLQGCYACTDWDVFTDSAADLDEATDVIMDYIEFCEGVCIPKKSVTSFPNEKPWFDRTIGTQLRAKELAFKSGDPSAIKKAKYDLRKAVKLAKLRYRDRLESELSVTDSRQL